MPDDANDDPRNNRVAAGGQHEVSLSIAEGMAGIDRESWNAVANPAGLPYDPFLDWDFLEALEATGCASPHTGWTPRHILVRDTEGHLLGAAPVYVKPHSRGEFVFDHAWADALERAGGRYYPKLLCAVPFTPATGRRLLALTGPHELAVKRLLIETAIQLCQTSNLSSAHFNFLGTDDATLAESVGLLPRTDQQYHWFNRGYQSFDDFLGALSSRKRKMLRKERAAAESDVTIKRLSGPDLRTEHWDAFFKFYMNTGNRKWGSPYLNRDFFQLLHERIAHRVLLVLAYNDGEPIAGALNLIGSDTLYGRYWGRTVDIPFLHFEVCYYQAIEHAIDAKLDRVEAGAQGDHKLARGYEPVTTRSAHWIAHPGLREAVARYLDSEREMVEDNIETLAAYTPFRKDARSLEEAARNAEEEF
ncbi:MAG: GNAT family N-acetyltransferase [Hyphomonadaceae bacterium]